MARLPKFKYSGEGQGGRRVEGEIEAKNLRQAKRALRAQGIKPRTVKAKNPFDVDLETLMVEKGLVPAFGAEELNRFTKQLSILINAGVPILDGLDILAKQEKKISFRVVINKVVEEVGSGKGLADAMETQKGFTKLYTSLIRAGETAGILDTILNKLTEFMEKQEAIKKQIKSAMTYPTIVVIVGIAVVAGLMVFVVPQFVNILEESGQEIPGVTQLVIDISDFFADYFIHMAVGLIAFVIVFSKWKKTSKGKSIWDNYVMKAPLFGAIVIKGNLASFTRTLATMLGAGVSILEALDICIDTIDNKRMAKDLKMVKDAVVKGKSITEPLGRIKYFPPLVNQMVKVGEETGNLDSMLIKVADVFEMETEEVIDTMTKLIEPIILVVLGGIIGTVLIAMYLPIFMSAGA